VRTASTGEYLSLRMGVVHVVGVEACFLHFHIVCVHA